MTTARLFSKVFLSKGVRALYTNSSNEHAHAYVKDLISHHPMEDSIIEELHLLLKNTHSPVERIHVKIHEEKIAGKIFRDVDLDIDIHQHGRSLKPHRH